MSKLISTLLLLWSSLSLSFTQSNSPWDTLAGPTVFQVLSQQEDTPTLRLETDWKKLIWNKRKEEYFPGKMTFAATDQQAIGFSVRMRARGNMRKEVCHFPPLKIKIKKKALAKQGFAKLNDLKMVIQCSKGARGEQYLFREYLLYQLHSILSEHTYATQLVRLEMVEETGDVSTLHGFLIEDEDDFAYRYRGRVVTHGRISPKMMQREALLHMCLFQYMILNNDWSIDNKHNVEFLLPEDATKVVPVPYDFDYAGLVGTSYAIPDPRLPIKSVFEPYFRGRGFSRAEVEKAAARFLEKRQEVINYTENYSWLAENERKKINRRLHQFFDLLENEKKRNREFVRRE